MTTRRSFLKMTMAAAAAAGMPWHMFIQKAYGNMLPNALSDPAAQPKFASLVPNALNPGFIFQPDDFNKYNISVSQAVQYTGLVGSDGSTPVPTTIWGYGDSKGGPTWPGRTFQVQSYVPISVKWQNKLDRLPIPVSSFGRSVVDTSLHWAYSLHGYEAFTLENDGFPIVPHVHGGHTDFQYDGNPEFFFSPGYRIRGPQWRDKEYHYGNDQPAGTVWYHDHALGITRLNVYAGMAGFFIIRDSDDTGLLGNPLDLPTYPYEAAFAIQDKMFDQSGGLFYPAYPGDPFYADFIYGEGADLSTGAGKYFEEFDNPNSPPEPATGYGPTALAEFFGDHFVVNGKIWPKMDVERRNYRLRLLNGCDSRFLAVQFFEVPPEATDFSKVIQQLDFTVIGSDQGLASATTDVDTLLIETGARYDVIVDFKKVTFGNRVIMKNIGGDEPFGGGVLMPAGQRPFPEMDRIMAFDVNQALDTQVPDLTPSGINFGPVIPDATRFRNVALFEGTDEYGRLQPLLGTAEPATDRDGNPINWPETPEYEEAGLIGQMEGAIAWHSPTTENPELDTTEEWNIWNVTGDAHPVHLHLVHFEILRRQEIVWDSNTLEDDRVIPNADYATPSGDGTYLETQPVVQHNGLFGSGFRVVNPTMGAEVPPDEDKPEAYVENAPKDMVTSLPDQVTIIRATFDKPGRYVWHCHILSHEDHEMMRVMLVNGDPGPGDGLAPGKTGKGRGRGKN
jgi:FtsP/CotA-like multicopper oxidase with cupredoxin domain